MDALGSMIAALAERLPDARLHRDDEAIRAVVRAGDAWFSARMRIQPFAEVFVQTRKLDGFELEVRWGDRLADPDVGDAKFDALFGLSTNDEALLRAWLDAPSRQALIDSAYRYHENLYGSELRLALELEPTARAYDAAFRDPNATRTWTYRLRDDELVATKGTHELDANRLAAVVATASTLAARSQRWATEYAALARELDATAHAEVELGGAPILTARRGAVDIEATLLRRAGPRDRGRLRTRIAARRLGAGGIGEACSLVSGALAKAARPPLPRGARHACPLAGYELRATSREAAARLDPPASALVELAAPGAVIAAAERVEVWFDGALSDRVRFDAAIELAARWAVDAGLASGPYR